MKLAFVFLSGVPLNKSLYTISYLLVTSAAAGITFCLLYVLVSFETTSLSCWDEQLLVAYDLAHTEQLSLLKVTLLLYDLGRYVWLEALDVRFRVDGEAFSWYLYSHNIKCSCHFDSRILLEGSSQ